MITTHSGMDAHSLEIQRDGKHIGFIQWHSGSEPRIVVTGPAFEWLTLSEIETAINAFRKAKSVQ